jgi:hypothetical protein
MNRAAAIGINCTQDAEFSRRYARASSWAVIRLRSADRPTEEGSQS